MAALESVLEKINSHLSFDQAGNDAMEILNADAQQAKENIRRVISCAINNLHLREHWLLQNVDQIHECIADMLQVDAMKAAQARGKLQACVDIAQLSVFDDSTNLSSYALSCLHEAQHLSTQEKIYEQGSLSFACDKSRLLKSFQQFGKLSCASLHARDDDAFDKSLQFADSEVMSSSSENPETEMCCGTNCVISSAGFDIEDMDKQISGALDPKSFDARENYCKAEKIICNDPEENSFDEPCCAAFCDIDLETNTYAVKIAKDMEQIGNCEDQQSNFSNSFNNRSSEIFDDFQTTVADMQKQFNDIINGDVSDAVTCAYQSENAVAWSVDALAQQLEYIANGRSVELKKSQGMLAGLESQINAITGSEITSTPASEMPNLAGKMTTLNLNSLPYFSKDSDSVPAATYQRIVESEKHQDSEKSDVDFSYLDKINGSTTLADLHHTILGIIDS